MGVVMKILQRLIQSACALFVMIVFPMIVFSVAAQAESVRQSVWDGVFYPASQDALQANIDDLLAQARSAAVVLPGKSLKALVFPHAGYVYSGLTAAHAALALEGKTYAKVILMGPDHRVGFVNVALTDHQAYETPLGRVALHPEADLLRRQSGLFQPSPLSDRKEHSLEVVLPFLQAMLPGFQLIPLVMGHSFEQEKIQGAIETLVDEQTLLVVSSDLSHFLDAVTAKATDRETLEMILQLDSIALRRSPNRACGIVPLCLLIEVAKKRDWQAVLLHYSHSGDTAGDPERVVGYGAIAFYGDQVMENQDLISSEQGQALVQLARQTIQARFNPGMTVALPPVLGQEPLQKEQGTFVTLKINSQLRGCIGNIIPSGSIVEGVRRNSLNAAFSDFRFRPLSEEELDDIHVEVSILTAPQPLLYEDSTDLIAKLRPDVDGVILSQGKHSATFLPQVWDQLPNPQDFLHHLCVKAGLAADAWIHLKLEIQTYQVQYFEE